jgi:hypothetical protein
MGSQEIQKLTHGELPSLQFGMKRLALLCMSLLLFEQRVYSRRVDTFILSSRD